MDHRNETPTCGKTQQKQNTKNSKLQYHVPLITKIGLSFIVLLLSCITVLANTAFVPFACSLLAAAALSYTCILTSSLWYALLLLPALGLSVFGGVDTIGLCMLLCLLAVAFAIYTCVRKKQNKTQTTLTVSVFLSVVLIAAAAYFLYESFGANTVSALKEIYTDLFDELKASLLLVFEETKETMIAQGAYTESYDVLFSEAYAAELVRQIRNIFLPSLCVILLAFSYFAVSAFVFISKNLRTDAIIAKDYRITVKAPTAVLYIISVVVMLLASSASFAYLAAQNFTILLSPALFIVGTREKITQIRANKRIPLSLIFYIFAFFISPMLPVYFLIFSGISETFAQNRKRMPES